MDEKAATDLASFMAGQSVAIAAIVHALDAHGLLSATKTAGWLKDVAKIVGDGQMATRGIESVAKNIDLFGAAIPDLRKDPPDRI